MCFTVQLSKIGFALLFVSNSFAIISCRFLPVKNFFQLFLKLFLFLSCSNFGSISCLPLSCQELFSRNFSVFAERRRRDLNPRAATNDLLPFQGSPFGQLGYFSKLPYLLSSSDIYLYRSQRQVILYLVSFMLSSTFLTFFKSFFIMYLTSGESGIRTHAPLRTNGFQDRLVMTTSISLHILFFNIFCAVLSAHVVFYHQISYLSITNLIFFSKNWTYSFNFRYMPIFTGIFPLFYSLFSLKNASAMTRSSGVVILILR